MRFLLTCLTFLLVVWTLSPLVASDCKFYNINELHGISMRQASSVCKDSNGFVWAATKSGILRLTDDDHRIYQ